MKNKIKDQTIIAAEIVIVILIIMMLMLPQLIGTVSVGRTKGAWKNFDDLNGKIIGIVDGSGTREFSDSIWDQYDIYYGADVDELAKLTEDGIITVADAYDTMTSKRSYRDAFPQHLAREEIVNGIGAQFDPDIARVMIRLIDQDIEYRMRESSV